MATKTLTTRIILRNDTANNWTTNNPVLLKGEIGLETDTGKYKIGDGTSNWQALQYYVNLDQDSKTSLDTLIEMLDDDNFGKVNDVQVNGTTVVQDKVANISIGVLTTSTTAQSEVSSGETFTNNIILHKISKTGSYADLLNKPNVIDNLDSTSSTDVLSANQGSVLKSMVQALPSAKSFTNIQAMITALNSYSNTEMNVGTSIYLQQTDVPDFWVYSKADSSVAYTYTDDSAFISAVETSGYVQVGYYNVAMLESAKVDLTDYYTKEEVDDLLNNVDLSNYVDLTSNQTIGGVKTFQNTYGQLILKTNFDSNVPYGLAIDGGKIILGELENVASSSGMLSVSISGRATGYGSVAIGVGSFASGENSIALGPHAGGSGMNLTAEAEGAIQLGKSYLNSFIINNTPYLFQVYDYPLLDGTTGKIPSERLVESVLLDTDTLVLDGGTSTITTV